MTAPFACSERWPDACCPQKQTLLEINRFPGAFGRSTQPNDALSITTNQLSTAQKHCFEPGSYSWLPSLSGTSPSWPSFLFSSVCLTEGGAHFKMAVKRFCSYRGIPIFSNYVYTSQGALSSYYLFFIVELTLFGSGPDPFCIRKSPETAAISGLFERYVRKQESQTAYTSPAPYGTRAAGVALPACAPYGSVSANDKMKENAEEKM
ncbi:MAG: hypothetical protein HFF40_06635 [Lawsonibacter sp.]|nr:hypothetical protein [Lawsonibacter sp.]